MTGRTSHPSGSDFFNVRLNGATSYFQHGMEANGSTVTSYGGSVTSMAMSFVAFAGSTASAFGASVVDILDPYSTTKNKTLRGLGGFSSSNIALRSGSWASTSSVTDITCLSFNGANWVTGSRFSLYGIKG
jgi:hypothetical protein